MTRLIAVIAAVAVLLSVGWYFGQRGSGALRDRIESQETACADQISRLEERARLAEARGYIWEARAELMLAVADIEAHNFGTASSRAGRARDRLTEAAAVPGHRLDLEPVRNRIERTLGRIQAMDADSALQLREAALELGRLLEKVGNA